MCSPYGLYRMSPDLVYLVNWSEKPEKSARGTRHCAVCKDYDTLKVLVVRWCAIKVVGLCKQRPELTDKRHTSALSG